MKRSLVLLCAVALASTSACGVFGSTSGKPSPSTLLGEGGVGATLTTPPTAAPITTTTTARPATTSPPGNRCPYTDPTSEIDFGQRLRLTLTVSVLCPTKASDIQLTLKVTNLSNEVIHYDQNQAQFFSLLAHPTGTGRVRWEDTNCQPPSRDRSAPAGNLAAGASLTFSTLYPAPKSVSDREKCRRLEPGGYSANAVFLVCDGEAYSDGYCDISKDTQFKAHPVLLDVRP